MENTDGIRPEKLKGRRAKIKNSNILVFIFFLFLSFVFWYLNSLGKDTEADIRYPVKYTNIPKNKALAAELPSRLSLNLKGTGYSILRLKASGKNEPVIIDFSKVGYKHDPDDKSSHYYIVTSGLVTGFNSQLKAGCKITSVKPDTLFFSFK